MRASGTGGDENGAGAGGRGGTRGSEDGGAGLAITAGSTAAGTFAAGSAGIRSTWPAR